MDILSRMLGFAVMLLFVGAALWLSFVIFSMLLVPLLVVFTAWWGWNFLIRKGILNPPKGRRTVWSQATRSDMAQDGRESDTTITVIETDYRRVDEP